MPKNSRRNNDISHVSDNEIPREFSPPPSRISRLKWQEILEDEYVNHIIGSIRDEIIRSAEDAIREGYLRKIVYGFVVNCACEAWMRAFQFAHLQYDDLGLPDDWTPDRAPSLVDKSPRLSRKVPTVYGRLGRLIAIQKSSSYCKAPCAKGASRRKNERSNTKIRTNP